MKIKVCGLRDKENIKALKKLPIDFMGFIFYNKSPRDVSQEKGLNEFLRDEQWNASIKKVGVFVNAQIHDLLHDVHDYHLDLVQLHGTESPEYCRELNDLWRISSMRGAKIIKAFSIEDATDFEQVQAYEAHCTYFLFDTKGEKRGGNGTSFDWNLLSNYQGITPFFLSGGITEDDVEAIRALRIPQLHGVDINSKFESEAAVKDVDRVSKFVHELKV